MAGNNFVIEVEKGKDATDGQPSIGPVYRSSFAANGFPAPIPGMESCWDIFRFVFSFLFFTLSFLLGC